MPTLDTQLTRKPRRCRHCGKTTDLTGEELAWLRAQAATGRKATDLAGALGCSTASVRRAIGKAPVDPNQQVMFTDAGAP